MKAFLLNNIKKLKSYLRLLRKTNFAGKYSIIAYLLTAILNIRQKLYKKHLVKIKVDSKYFFIRLLSGDISTLRQVFLEEAYEKKIKASGFVIDAGGHIGSFAIKASDNATSVISFEPIKENYDILCENIRLNKLNSVCALNVGLADTEGLKNFDFDSSSISTSTSSFKRGKKNINMVLVTTIDSYCNKNKIKEIDFIKLDVEGGELEVLKGSIKMLKKCKPYIAAEIHSERLEKEITKFLKSFGYTLDGMYKNSCPCPILYYKQDF